QRPMTLTLFPYTTLFRSVTSKSATTKNQVKASTGLGRKKAAPKLTSGKKTVGSKKNVATKAKPTSSKGVSAKKPALKRTTTMKRSEEHTSELQSRENLVC